MASSNPQEDIYMYSVYIPKIHKSYQNFSIVTLFERNRVGYVERVDFVDFQNDEKNGYRQAFVHFRPHQKSAAVWEEIQGEGSYRFYPYQQYRHGLVTDVSEKQQNEYWILLKNNTPVPKTELNVDQLAHNQKLMEEREAKMEERMAQLEKREAEMEERMAKMEEKMALTVQVSDKFAKTFAVQTMNMQTLSDIVCKRNEPVTSANPDMIELEQKISELQTETDNRYWQLISKNESLAVDVSTLYERLWLDVEKLIKKTDKNIANIADGDHRVWELTNKFKSTEERVYRVVDVVELLVEQVEGKTVSDFKAEIMRYGKPSDS